jgi:acetylornithine deacetylase/succinyl-diaminopimelate desuccinylase-like protein
MEQNMTIRDSIDPTIYQRPVELLQRLIRFDTSNPPGNEKACIDYISELLKVSGIDSECFSRDPERPNLVARLRGKSGKNGGSAPLLLYGHVDVVPAKAEEWTHPPFAGTVADDYVWGRGSLDMKGAVAMMLSAFIKAKVEEVELPGDVVLCILSDEEVLGDFGARFMVENYEALFKDIRYALGEFGGFSLYVAGKKFYPIEIAQKQKCGIKATIKGPAGHGSSFVQGGTMAKLAKMLEKLDQNQLPVHITTAVQQMFSKMADSLGFPQGFIIRQLLNPKRTDFILKRLGEKGAIFMPMFHNTVNATIVRGGDKINVIPSKIEVELDVRLVPGSTPEEVLQEIQGIIGDKIQLEVLFYDEGPGEPDMGMYETLAWILKDLDPEGIPVPLLITGSTDGRFFSRLGIQTYGFIPMQLPDDLNFSRTIHSADERIPVSSLAFGTEAIYRAMMKHLPDK